MYCDNRTPNFNNSKDRDCILEQIKKIDQLQKEAMIEEECDNCDGGLMFKLFNTKPVILYLSKGEPFRAEIPGTDDTTKIFRIQEIKGECVVLRLIVKDCEKFICTNFTITLRISCICAIQCLQPICCKECKNNFCPKI